LRQAYDAAKNTRDASATLWSIPTGALLIEPHRADMQERDGGGAMLQVSRSLFPYIRLAELRRFGS